MGKSSSGRRALSAAVSLTAAVAVLPPAVAIAAKDRPVVAWVKTFDGGVAHNDEVADTATAADGSVAVTGKSMNGNGDRDIVTIVYAADGTRRWLARFDGAIQDWPVQATWNDRAQNVAFDSAGNVYVTGWTWRGMDFDGGTNEDIVVLKYSPTGTLLWKRLYNGPVNHGDFPTDLEIDDSGNVYLTGYSEGGQIDVRYYYESVALKFSPTGVQQWARRYSFDQRGDIAWSGALDPEGNFLVSGGSTGYNGGSMKDTFTIKYTPGGAVAWIAPIKERFNVQRTMWNSTVDPSGNVYVVGFDLRDDPRRQPIFLFKYSGETGALLWRRWWDAPGAGDDWGRYVATDAAGNVYLAGEHSDATAPFPSADAVLLKYSPDGTRLWERIYSGPDCSCTGWDGDPQLEVTSTGDAYLALQSQDADGRYRFTALKYLPDGTRAWLKRVPAHSRNDVMMAMALDGQNNVILAGNTSQGAAGSVEQHLDYMVAKLLAA